MDTSNRAHCYVSKIGSSITSLGRRVKQGMSFMRLFEKVNL